MVALPKPTSICSTSHRQGGVAAVPYTENYLLPISSNLEQNECANSMCGDEPSDGPVLIPHRCNALLVDCPTGS